MLRRMREIGIHFDREFDALLVITLKSTIEIRKCKIFFQYIKL